MYIYIYIYISIYIYMYIYTYMYMYIYMNRLDPYDSLPYCISMAFKKWHLYAAVGMPGGLAAWLLNSTGQKEQGEPLQILQSFIP